MANIDYQNTAQGMLTTVAELVSAVDPKATVFSLTNLLLAGGIDDRIVGGVVYVDDEVCVITAIGAGTITVGRGCWDTIPADHAAGALVWFPDFPVAYDPDMKLGNETVSVKLCTFTPSGNPVPVESAPPTQLTMQFRFLRPYPPGNLQVSATPWCDGPFAINNANTTRPMTWAHRDRKTQGDLLVPHSAASIGPEVGTTYVLRFYRSSDNAYAGQVTGITAASYNLVLDSLVALFKHMGTGVLPIYVVVESLRGGYSSLYKYRVNLTVALVNTKPSNLSFSAQFSRPRLSRDVTPRSTSFAKTVTRPTLTT